MVNVLSSFHIWVEVFKEQFSERGSAIQSRELQKTALLMAINKSTQCTATEANKSSNAHMSALFGKHTTSTSYSCTTFDTIHILH